MTFELKTTATEDNATIKASDIRKALVQGLYIQTASMLASGDWTRVEAVKAMKPLQDTLHAGVKTKGHAYAIEQAVNDNLDAAIEYLDAQEGSEA